MRIDRPSARRAARSRPDRADVPARTAAASRSLARPCRLAGREPSPPRRRRARELRLDRHAVDGRLRVGGDACAAAAAGGGAQGRAPRLVRPGPRRGVARSAAASGGDLGRRPQRLRPPARRHAGGAPRASRARRLPHRRERPHRARVRRPLVDDPHGPSQYGRSGERTPLSEAGLPDLGQRPSQGRDGRPAAAGAFRARVGRDRLGARGERSRRGQRSATPAASSATRASSS